MTESQPLGSGSDSGSVNWSRRVLPSICILCIYREQPGNGHKVTAVQSDCIITQLAAVLCIRPQCVPIISVHVVVDRRFPYHNDFTLHMVMHPLVV